MRLLKAAKVVVFLASLVPFTWLLWLFLIKLDVLPPNDWLPQLSPNFKEDLRNITGDWSLRFLVATLALTPLRRITGWNGFMRFRRMFGLFAFFYASVHFIEYLVLEVDWDLSELWKDISLRPFITVGVISLLLMVPLAITSTKGWIRRLGGRRWQILHYLIYPSAVAGVIHYYWKVKLVATNPLIYAGVFAVLFAYRIWVRLSRLETR